MSGGHPLRPWALTLLAAIISGVLGTLVPALSWLRWCGLALLGSSVVIAGVRGQLAGSSRSAPPGSRLDPDR
jgi:hypothetical protein